MRERLSISILVNSVWLKFSMAKYYIYDSGLFLVITHDFVRRISFSIDCAGSAWRAD